MSIPLLIAQLVIAEHDPLDKPYPLSHYRHVKLPLYTAILHPVGVFTQPEGDKIYPELHCRHVEETPFESLH